MCNIFHKGEKLNPRETFRFEALGQVKGAMNRQIAEVLQIKNSKSILMNDRDMYTRCILPEIPRLQRGKAPAKSHKRGRSLPSEDIPPTGANQEQSLTSEDSPDNQIRVREEKIKFVLDRVIKKTGRKRYKKKKFLKESSRPLSEVATAEYV